jgi:hypothetical protein
MKKNFFYRQRLRAVAAGMLALVCAGTLLDAVLRTRSQHDNLENYGESLFPITEPTGPYPYTQLNISMAPSGTKDEVEAAYLYDFAKFIRWPKAAAGQPISLCVLKDEPLASALQRIVAGEVVDGRNLRAKSLNDVSQGEDCNILFLGASEDLHVQEDLAVLHHAPVVTVSNDADFLQQGGIIQFAMIGGAVRFSVNLDAARRAGVTLSSQLLKVALSVKGNAQAMTQ